MELIEKYGEEFLAKFPMHEKALDGKGYCDGCGKLLTNMFDSANDQKEYKIFEHWNFCIDCVAEKSQDMNMFYTRWLVKQANKTPEGQEALAKAIYNLFYMNNNKSYQEQDIHTHAAYLDLDWLYFQTAAELVKEMVMKRDSGALK